MPAESKQAFAMATRWIPQTDRPLVTVRTNLPDGILINSYWNRSMKQEIAMAGVYNPVTIGLMASMAIPAFQKVRQSSQEKAVTNNLRQLAAAADQFYLETGKNSATYADLVGSAKYIRQINPVAGEDYRTLIFKQGLPLRVNVPTLRKTISYPR
jgi:type IV pilus assembly protein PilA